MNLTAKLSLHAKYYLMSFLNLGVCWGILALLNIDFLNVIFFLTAFVWHFALVTPGLKEKVMTHHHKLSFLAVVVRLNHYLQLFINLKKVPYSSSFIRALSPVTFTFLLFILGGGGNLLFTLLGSFCFEVIYLIIKKKTSWFEESTLLVHTNDSEIPPAIPSAEKNHE